MPISNTSAELKIVLTDAPDAADSRMKPRVEPCCALGCDKRVAVKELPRIGRVGS